MSANLYAVVHSKDSNEALDNANLAIECGMNGVFFISHGEMSSNDLMTTASSFGALGHKTGINFLIQRLQPQLTKCCSYEDITMLWSDLIPSDEEWDFIKARRSNNEFTPTFFGGVAFKYQTQPDDLFKAAQDSIACLDVLTTSGVATGRAPDLEKLAILAEGFGDKIGIASGVSSSNIASMLPYVDHFLVATSISKDFHNLDKDKCLALVEACRSAE